MSKNAVQNIIKSTFKNIFENTAKITVENIAENTHGRQITNNMFALAQGTRLR